MKIPLSWLREYVDWPWEPEELADRLTMAGVKIETVEKVGDGFRGVIAGRVLKIVPHPNPAPVAGAGGPAAVPAAKGCPPAEGAHYHWVVDLDTGSAKRQVVAGIANMKMGDIVPYAPPGSVLPGEWKIGTASIRGVASEGMLLSLSEFLLGEKPREGEGILVLPSGIAPGADLGQALGLPDTVLELDLTPNYAVHCQSILGVAREVAALTEAGPSGVRRPDPHARLRPGGAAAGEACRVDIAAPDLCSRYVARVIRGVTLGPSPWHVQYRVLAAGMRPISNIVDATNYVMLETGQPLHAFDLARLVGRHIIVRRAAAGEKMTTLDRAERVLLESDLIITDEAGPVAIAGVMGGLESEVTAQTRDILLESATFEPRSVRRTATRLGLPSEAAGRFDKGVDPVGGEPASALCAALMAETAGGTVAPGAVDAYPVPYQPREIALRTNRISALLGVELQPAEISTYLTRLGFGTRPAPWKPGQPEIATGRTGASGGAPSQPDLLVAIPSWRRDVFEEADLAEEAGRLYGYNRIPSTLPRMVTTVGGKPPRARVGDLAARAMVSLGFYEALSSALVDPGQDEALSPVPGRALALSNPLTGTHSAMRTGLLGSLMEAVVRNRSRAERDLRLFEMAPVYWANEGDLGPANLPVEKVHLAAVATTAGSEAAWPKTRPDPDFYYAKGLVTEALRDLGVEGWTLARSQDRRFHPGRQARVVIPAQAGSGEPAVELGTLGELHPQVLRNYDIDGRVSAFELDIDAVTMAGAADVRFADLPRYPAVTRDVAVVLPASVEVSAIRDLIASSAGALGAAVDLFDVYQGPPVPEGKRSTAWRVTYRSGERSLTDAEVDEVHARVRAVLERELGAALR